MKRLRIIVAIGIVLEDLVDFPVIVRLPASIKASTSNAKSPAEFVAVTEDYL